MPGNDVRAGRREGPAARSDVMRRWLWCAVLAVSVAARAQEGHAPAHECGEPASGEHAARRADGEEKVDTSSYILEHVADSPEVGFQVPLTDKEFVIHFPVWRIPLKAGACPADRGDAGEPHRGLPGPHLHQALVLDDGGLGSSWCCCSPSAPTGTRSSRCPHGPRQNILEMLVLFVRNEIAIPNIGKEEGPRYTPYLLSVFFFILTLNLLGLVPWASTATGNLGVTLAPRALHLRPDPVRQHPGGGHRRVPQAPDRRRAVVALADHDPGGDPRPVHQALRPDAPALRQHAGRAHRHLLPAGADLHHRARRGGGGRGAVRDRSSTCSSSSSPSCRRTSSPCSRRSSSGWGWRWATTTSTHGARRGPRRPRQARAGGQAGERAGVIGSTRTPRPDAARGGRPKGHPRPPHKRVLTSKVRNRKS